MFLDHFLVLLRLIHAQVVQEVSAVRDFAKEAVARGVVLLVIMQVLRQVTDLIRQNGNLHGRRTGVLLMLTMLGDEFLFLRALEGHNEEGEKKEERSL